MSSLAAAYLAAACLALGGAGCSGDEEETPAGEPAPITTRLELRQDMRDAWSDHVAWTRVTLIASVADLPEAPKATARLLDSQDSIGETFGRFYGVRQGDELAALLHAHVVAEADVLAAMQAGNTDEAARATGTWHDNASAVAELLADASPRLRNADIHGRMRRHVDQSIEEAHARIEGDWDADIAVSYRIVDDILDLSDTIAAAMAAELPEKVGEGAPLGAANEALHVEMRALWTDHALRTRFFLMSAIAELPDTSAATGRILQNQADLGDAFRPYYGDAVADQLTGLLEGHILIAAQVVMEAQAPPVVREAIDIPGASARDRWELNADQIVALLASQNPAWDAEELRGMMHVHLAHVYAQASSRLADDWDADIAAYDEGIEHLLRMADVLSDGVAAQFPERLGAD